MGDPIKIVDLAETMIRLSGFEPESRHRHRDSLGSAPARSSTRSCSTPTSVCSPRRPQHIVRAHREPLDPNWVDRFSTTSTCWCWRATPPAWPSTSPSSMLLARSSRPRTAPGSRRRLPRGYAISSLRALAPFPGQFRRCRRGLCGHPRVGHPRAPVLRAGSGDGFAAGGPGERRQMDRSARIPAQPARAGPSRRGAATGTAPVQRRTRGWGASASGSADRRTCACRSTGRDSPAAAGSR